ncbi:energy coupling factor transporter S component ThiW [Staphylococcus aureus]
MKAAPVQHFVNVLSAVIVVSLVWISSSAYCLVFVLVQLLHFRVVYLLEFYSASMFYIYRKHIFMAAVGEVLGTGVIGSLICIPLAYFLGFILLH